MVRNTINKLLKTIENLVRNTINKLLKTIEKNEGQIYNLLTWIFGLLALGLVGVYGSKAFFEDISVVGTSFVMEELPLPFFPWFYAKPITWFSFFAFCWVVFGLETHRKHFLRLKPPFPKMLFGLIALIAFGSGYEVLWNFAIWIALMSIAGPHLHPDVSVNIFNVPRAVNLVFATKLVFLVFGVSVYLLYFLVRIYGNFKDENAKLRK